MPKTRIVAWMVWIIASIFYAYQYILRVIPNILMNDVMHHFDIDAATFGQFSGIYYIGYSLMHLPLGILLDRFGPRKVMASCILLSVTGLLPLILADHWIYPIVGRLILGMGSSAAILGVFKIVRMTFTEEKFPRMLSFSVTIGLIGAIYGGGPVNYMRDTFGYEFVVITFICMGIFLALITYWIVPEMKTSAEVPMLSNVKEVLTNGRVILCCIFAGLMVGPLEGFADVWGSAFLKQVYGYEGTTASSLLSMIFIGMCFGAPVLSFVAEKAKSYVGTIVGAGFIMAASFFAMLMWPLSSGALSFSFVLIGVCSAYQILAIYQASTYVAENVAGLTTAVANMIIMIFGYAFHTTIGATINSAGGTSDSTALLYGVSVVPIALCLGTVGFISILIIDRSRERKIEPVKTLG